MLAGGLSAREAVVRGCALLEDDPLFNAGTGSAIQSDGQVRMSASLMCAETHAFSGVINAQRVPYPIQIADQLQDAHDRVLDGQGVELFARHHHIPLHDPLTARRLDEWVARHRREDGPTGQAAHVTAPREPDDGRGTVGLVALDVRGHLAAATSTGGRGFEWIGRVSDSATVAGNYATPHAAVSCTGIGEHIVDEALAARIVVRVEEGLSLVDAMNRSMKGCARRGRDLAAIAIDQQGHICWGKTSEALLAAYHNGHERGDSLGAVPGMIVGHVAPHR